jgi:hypothetical protein
MGDSLAAAGEGARRRTRRRSGRRWRWVAMAGGVEEGGEAGDGRKKAGSAAAPAVW